MAYRSPIFDSKGREIPSDIVVDHARRRLDAAAPDMLAALKRLRDLYGGIYLKMSDKEAALCRKVWGVADAVIAKAEGRP